MNMVKLQRTGSRLSTLGQRNRRSMISPKNNIFMDDDDDDYDDNEDTDDEYYNPQDYDYGDFNFENANCKDDTILDIKEWAHWYMNDFSFFDVKKTKNDHGDSDVVGVEIGGDMNDLKDGVSNRSNDTTHRRENFSSRRFGLSATEGKNKTSSGGGGLIATSDSCSIRSDNDYTLDSNIDHDSGVHEILERAKECVVLSEKSFMQNFSLNGSRNDDSKSSRRTQTKLVKGLSTSSRSFTTGGGGMRFRGGMENRDGVHPPIVLINPQKKGNDKKNRKQIFVKLNPSGGRDSSSTMDYMTNLSNSKSSFSGVCDISTISGSDTSRGSRLKFWKRRGN